MPPLIDLTGQRFGKLVAERQAGRNDLGQVLWACRCDCGGETVAITGLLRRGGVTTCGCSQRRHGGARRGEYHPLYHSWLAMRDRCRNPNNKRWDRYVGRGITVAPEWDDFAVFLRDVGERPPGRTLDRIDPDGNYEPGNVRWATAREQRLNRSLA